MSRGCHQASGTTTSTDYGDEWENTDTLVGTTTSGDTMMPWAAFWVASTNGIADVKRIGPVPLGVPEFVNLIPRCVLPS